MNKAVEAYKAERFKTLRETTARYVKENPTKTFKAIAKTMAKDGVTATSGGTITPIMASCLARAAGVKKGRTGIRYKHKNRTTRTTKRSPTYHGVASVEAQPTTFDKFRNARTLELITLILASRLSVTKQLEIIRTTLEDQTR